MPNPASELINELMKAVKSGNESQIDDATRNMVVLSRVQAIDLLRRLEALPAHYALNGVAASAQRSLSDQVGELSTYIPALPSPTVSTIEQSSFLETESRTEPPLTDKVELPPFLTEKIEPEVSEKPKPVLVKVGDQMICSVCGCVMQRATAAEVGNTPSYHKCLDDNFYL